MFQDAAATKVQSVTHPEGRYQLVLRCTDAVLRGLVISDVRRVRCVWVAWGRRQYKHDTVSLALAALWALAIPELGSSRLASKIIRTKPEVIVQVCFLNTLPSWVALPCPRPRGLYLYLAVQHSV